MENSGNGQTPGRISPGVPFALLDTAPSNASLSPTQLSDSVLNRALEGSTGAMSLLLRLHMPRLHRWAHGRLPPWLRRVVDTGDLVQNAVLDTMRRLPMFRPQSNTALAVYLRSAVLNQIRDEHRRLKRHGVVIELGDNLVARTPSPFDEASLEETLSRYRAALATLRPKDQELVVGHIELGYSHAQLGCMTVRSPNAARVALRRALQRLTEQMLDG